MMANGYPASLREARDFGDNAAWTVAARQVYAVHGQRMIRESLERGFTSIQREPKMGLPRSLG